GGPRPDEGRRRLRHQAADRRGPRGQARDARDLATGRCLRGDRMSATANLGLTGPTPSLPTADFEYVAALVADRAGIEVGPDKSYLVEQRLAAVARDEKLASIPELIARSRADASGRLAGLV